MPDFTDLMCQTYQGLVFKDRYASECGLLSTYWEDLQACTSRDVLEIGYGDGTLLAFLLERGYNATGLEVDHRVETKLQENLKQLGSLSQRFESRIGDIRDYQKEVDKYALISVSYVLHFLQENEAVVALDKLKESLAPGGLILLRVHDAEMRARFDEQQLLQFSHLFRQEELDRSFREGFKILFASKFLHRTPRSENERMKASAEHFGGSWSADDYLYSSLEYLVQKHDGR